MNWSGRRGSSILLQHLELGQNRAANVMTRQPRSAAGRRATGSGWDAALAAYGSYTTWSRWKGRTRNRVLRAVCAVLSGGGTRKWPPADRGGLIFACAAIGPELTIAQGARATNRVLGLTTCGTPTITWNGDERSRAGGVTELAVPTAARRSRTRCIADGRSVRRLTLPWGAAVIGLDGSDASPLWGRVGGARQRLLPK